MKTKTLAFLFLSALCTFGQTNLTELQFIEVGTAPFGAADLSNGIPKSDVARVGFQKANTNFLILSNLIGNFNFVAPVVSNSFNTFNIQVSNSLTLKRSWFVLDSIDWTNSVWLPPSILTNLTCTNASGPYYADIASGPGYYSNACGFKLLFNTQTNLLPGWNVPTNQIAAIVLSNSACGVYPATNIADGLYLNSGVDLSLNTNLSPGTSFTNVSGTTNFIFQLPNSNTGTNFIAYIVCQHTNADWSVSLTNFPVEADAYGGNASSGNCTCGVGVDANKVRFYYGHQGFDWRTLPFTSLPVVLIPPSTNPPPFYSTSGTCRDLLLKVSVPGAGIKYLKNAQAYMAAGQLCPGCPSGSTCGCTGYGLRVYQGGTTNTTWADYWVAGSLVYHMVWTNSTYWDNYPPVGCGYP